MACYGKTQQECNGETCQWINDACQQKCENPLIDDLNCFANPTFLKHFKNATLQKSSDENDPKLCVDKQDLDFDINVGNNTPGSLFCNNGKMGNFANSVSGSLASIAESEIMSGMGIDGVSFEAQVLSMLPTRSEDLLKIMLAVNTPLTPEDALSLESPSTIVNLIQSKMDDLKTQISSKPNPSGISDFEAYNVLDEDHQLLHTSIDFRESDYNSMFLGAIGEHFEDLRGEGWDDAGFMAKPIEIKNDSFPWDSYSSLWTAAQPASPGGAAGGGERGRGGGGGGGGGGELGDFLNDAILNNEDHPNALCKIGGVSFDNDETEDNRELCISTSGDINLEQIVQNCKTDAQSNAKFNVECCDLLDKPDIFSSGDFEKYTKCKINNFVNVNLINNIKTHPLISGAIAIVCILILLITISSIMIMKDNPLLTLLFIIIFGSGIGIYIYQNPNLYDQIFRE